MFYVEKIVRAKIIKYSKVFNFENDVVESDKSINLFDVIESYTSFI